MMEWFEVDAPPSRRQGKQHWVSPYSTFGSGLSRSSDIANVVMPYARGATAPITAAQLLQWDNGYFAGGNYGHDANASFNAWVATMATAVPQLNAALDRAEKANLFNLIGTSLAGSLTSPWRGTDYTLNALNGYLSNPSTLSNVLPLWVYVYTGSGLDRARLDGWGCDTSMVKGWCLGGIGNSIGHSLCECVGCCYDLQYGRLPESIPALDSWGDLAGVHAANGVWTCPQPGPDGCGPTLPTCDANHPCNAHYSCVHGACILDTVDPNPCHGPGTSCASDGACCTGLTCQGGTCNVPAPTCSSQAECTLGYVCVNGVCVPAGTGNCLPANAGCSYDSQCCTGLLCLSDSQSIGHCTAPGGGGGGGGGSGSLIIVLGILGVIGVGVALATSEPGY